MRTSVLPVLVLTLSAVSSVSCQSCNPVGAVAGVEVRLTEIASHRATFKVHACYGSSCVDRDVAGTADGDSPTVFIPISHSPGPAETLTVRATDPATGQVLVDANAPFNVAVRKTGSGGCTVDTRFIAVEVTSDGKFRQVR